MEGRFRHFPDLPATTVLHVTYLIGEDFEFFARTTCLHGTATAVAASPSERAAKEQVDVFTKLIATVLNGARLLRVESCSVQNGGMELGDDVGMLFGGALARRRSAEWPSTGGGLISPNVPQ